MKILAESTSGLFQFANDGVFHTIRSKSKILIARAMILEHYPLKISKFVGSFTV
jgi:hypothetical protein